VLSWRRPDAGTAIERHQATKMMPGRALPVALVEAADRAAPLRG
jgi:hypothetical protein